MVTMLFLFAIKYLPRFLHVFYRSAVYHVVMLLSSICIILRNIGSTKDTYVSVYGNTILGVNGDGSY